MQYWRGFSLWLSLWLGVQVLADNPLDSLIGRCAEEQLQKETGARLRRQGADADYLERVGEKTAGFADREGRFEYAVLDTDEILSFGLPNGLVVLSRGSLKLAGGNEAEISSEISRRQIDIEQKHGVKKMAGNAAIDWILKQGLKLKISGDQTPSVISANALVRRLLATGLDADEQNEADRLGFNLYCQAGFDPVGAFRYLRKMEALRLSSNSGDFRPNSLAGSLFGRSFSSGIVERYIKTHQPERMRSELMYDELLVKKYGKTFRGEVGQTGVPAALASGYHSPTGRSDLKVIADFLAYGRDYLPGQYHLGEDIAAELGNPIYALADGDVWLCSRNGWGTGNCALVVKHADLQDKAFLTVYGHLKYEKGITKEQGKVAGGELLGKIGAWQPPHLHLGIHPELVVPKHLGLAKLPSGFKPGDRLDDFGFVAPLAFLSRHSSGSQPALDSQSMPNELMIYEAILNLGDHPADKATIVWDARFALYPAWLASLKSAEIRFEMRALPAKDPIVSLNRHEVGRAIPDNSEWTTFTFGVKKEWLRTDNLIDLQAYIPDVPQGFDDSEVRRLVLTLKQS